MFHWYLLFCQGAHHPTIPLRSSLVIKAISNPLKVSARLCLWGYRVQLRSWPTLTPKIVQKTHRLQSVVQSNRPTSWGGVRCSKKVFSVPTVRSQKSAHQFGLISVERTQGPRHCLRGGIYFSCGHSACSKQGCSAPRCMVLPPLFLLERTKGNMKACHSCSLMLWKWKKIITRWQWKQGSRARLFIPSVGWVSLAWQSPQNLCRDLIVATVQDQHTLGLQYHTSASRKALYHDSGSSLVTMSSSARRGRKSWAKISPYLLSAPVIDTQHVTRSGGQPRCERST